MGCGRQRSGQHHATVRAIELHGDCPLEVARCQLAVYPRAVGKREPHGDRCLLEARVELVEDGTEVAVGILLALRSVVTDCEGCVEDALELPPLAGRELQSGQRQVDDAVEDHALESLRVCSRIGLRVCGAVGLAKDADVGGAKCRAEVGEVLNCLGRADVRQEPGGRQFGGAGVDEADGRRLRFLLRIPERSGIRFGTRETATASDPALVEEDDVVAVKHLLGVPREVAVGTEDAAGTRATGGHDKEAVAGLVRRPDGKGDLDPARVGRIEVVERHAELDAGELAVGGAGRATEGLERAGRARACHRWRQRG